MMWMNNDKARLTGNPSNEDLAHCLSYADGDSSFFCVVMAYFVDPCV